VAGGGGTGGGNPGIDLTGTWISEVKTSGQLAVPLVGMTAANIDLIIALQLSKAAGKLNGVFSICKLTTVTTPNASSLTVQFTPKVISTLTTTMSENDFTAMVGQPVPVPALEILSGETAGGVSVDADADNHPGVTIPSNIGGILPINAYVGLDIKVAMKATTLTNANTITGTTSFTTDGKVFGSNNALLTMGTISVTPSSSSIAFTATKLAGAVACSDVLTHF